LVNADAVITACGTISSLADATDGLKSTKVDVGHFVNYR
jgi:hypothetical protein